MGGYILANTVGDIIAYSEAYLPNSVHINNNDLFNQIGEVQSHRPCYWH
jgi:hypothetical protein